jgi:hypothetical protein
MAVGLMQDQQAAGLDLVERVLAWEAVLVEQNG